MNFCFYGPCIFSFCMRDLCRTQRLSFLSFSSFFCLALQKIGNLGQTHGAARFYREKVESLLLCQYNSSDDS